PLMRLPVSAPPAMTLSPGSIRRAQTMHRDTSASTTSSPALVLPGGSGGYGSTSLRSVRTTSPSGWNWADTFVPRRMPIMAGRSAASRPSEARPTPQAGPGSPVEPVALDGHLPRNNRIQHALAGILEPALVNDAP